MEAVYFQRVKVIQKTLYLPEHKEGFLLSTMNLCLELMPYALPSRRQITCMNFSPVYESHNLEEKIVSQETLFTIDQGSKPDTEASLNYFFKGNNSDYILKDQSM